MIKPNTNSFRQIVILIGIVCTIGCDSKNVARQTKTNFLDSPPTQLHSLGWMGAKSHPLVDSFKMTDPDNEDKEVTPGGVVVAEFTKDSPLENAGVKIGDVVLRIADNWVPIKEDPTLDLIALTERQISANKREIPIGVYRAGKYELITLETQMESIDEGLPLPTQRFTDAAESGLKYLAQQQNDDGSITGNAGSNEQLLNTALAGLAFISADESIDDTFQSNADRCVKFFETALAPEPLELDTLTASYVAIFLAESDVDLMDLDWLDRVSKLTEVFETNQHESGGWNVTEIATDDPEEAAIVDNDQSAKTLTEPKEVDESVDILGTFTTNQVLLAIGAMERKGFDGEADTIEKGVGYLHQQNRLRVPAPIDRRIKAALSAGTTAALIALNCDRNDIQLREYLKSALERSSDMYTSPTLAMPGLLHLALASRQLGNESWLQFYDATKYYCVAMSAEDGSAIEYPNIEQGLLEFESAAQGTVWRTSHLALIQSMQSKQLKRLLAIDSPPQLATRDGNGKKVSAESLQSVQAMKIEGNPDVEELKKMIMDRLKEQGMEVDESKIKISGSKKEN